MLELEENKFKITALKENLKKIRKNEQDEDYEYEIYWIKDKVISLKKETCLGLCKSCTSFLYTAKTLFEALIGFFNRN